MKRNKLMTFVFMLVVLLFGGIASVSAATTLPDNVTSDNLREVEYIKNFPVIIKKTTVLLYSIDFKKRLK